MSIINSRLLFEMINHVQILQVKHSLFVPSLPHPIRCIGFLTAVPLITLPRIRLFQLLHHLILHVNLPDGSHAKINGIGSTTLNSKLHTDGVLCVPSFRVNLLSASKLTRKLKCSAHFFPTFCVLQDLASKKMIGLGKQINGL